MTKFYTILAVAAISLSASAQQFTVETQSTPKLENKDLPGAVLHQANPELKANIDITNKFGAVNPEELKGKALSRSAIAQADVEGEWDYSYYDYFDKETVTGTVTFTYYSNYSQFLVLFDHDTNKLGFWADFDPTAGTLTFNQEYLTNSGNYSVYQLPLNGTSLATTLVGTYNDATKSFEFPSAGGLGHGAVSGGTVAGFYYRIEQISITKPDGDYKVGITMSSECNASNEFTYTVTKGNDIAKVYALEIEGDFDATENINYIPLLGKEIEVNKVYSLKPAADMEESGYYSVLIAGADAQGNLRKATQAAVYVNLPEEGAYKTLGTFEFEDPFVCFYYNNFTHININAVLEENIENPGLFRIVNPYKGAKQHHSDDCSHYFYLDTRDAEFVTVPASSTGMDFGDGILVLGSLGGALGYSKEQCKASGYAIPTLSGRTITFPDRSILAHEQKYNSPGTWGYITTENPVTITLPDLKLNVTVVDDDSQPVEGATVAVEGVTGTTDAQGVAKLTLPATIDYLAKVDVNVTDKDGSSTKESIELGAIENNATVTLGTTGIGSITADDENAPAEYYNMLGVRVSNPEAGQIVIKRQGSTVSKVLVK